MENHERQKNRHRHCRQRTDTCAEVPHEQEKYDDNPDCSIANRLNHVVDCGTNEVGLLKNPPLDQNICRQVGLQCVKDLTDLTIQFQRIRARLLLDSKNDCRSSFDTMIRFDANAAIATFYRTAETDLSDFLNENGPFATPYDRRVCNIFKRQTLATNTNQRLARRANHDATPREDVGFLRGIR